MDGFGGQQLHLSLSPHSLTYSLRRGAEKLQLWASPEIFFCPRRNARQQHQHQVHFFSSPVDALFPRWLLHGARKDGQPRLGPERTVRRHVGDVRTWRGQTRELQTVILLQMVPSHDKEPDIIHYTHLNITKHFNQLYPSVSTLQSTCTCQERKRGGEKKKEDKGYERRRGVARSDANPTRFRSSAALCDWKKLARSEVIYFLDGGGWRIICEERSWRWWRRTARAYLLTLVWLKYQNIRLPLATQEHNRKMHYVGLGWLQFTNIWKWLLV